MSLTTGNSFMLDKKEVRIVSNECSPMIPSENVIESLVLNTVSENNL